MVYMTAQKIINSGLHYIKHWGMTMCIIPSKIDMDAIDDKKKTLLRFATSVAEIADH